MTLLSAFGGGLWIIPVGLFLAGQYSLYKAIKASKSGSKYYNNTTGKWDYRDENVPLHSVGGTFWFAVALTVAAIGSFFWMLADK